MQGIVRGLEYVQQPSELEHYRRRLARNASLVSRLSLESQLDAHSGCVNTINWNNQGDLLVSGSDDTCLCIWKPHSPKQLLAKVQTGHRANIFCSKFVPHANNSKVVCCAGDAQIRVFDINKQLLGLAPQSFSASSQPSDPSLDPLFVYRCHASRVKKLVMDPWMPFVFLSASEDGVVRQFDMRVSHTCEDVPHRTHGYYITNRPSLRDTDRCKDTFVLRCSSSELSSIALNEANPFEFAVCGDQPFVRSYDRRMIKGSNHPLRVYCPQPIFNNEMLLSQHVTSVQYSRDGKGLLASYSSFGIYLFDVGSSTDALSHLLLLEKNGASNNAMRYPPWLMNMSESDESSSSNDDDDSDDNDGWQPDQQVSEEADLREETEDVREEIGEDEMPQSSDSEEVFYNVYQQFAEACVEGLNERLMQSMSVDEEEEQEGDTNRRNDPDADGERERNQSEPQEMNMDQGNSETNDTSENNNGETNTINNDEQIDGDDNDDGDINEFDFSNEIWNQGHITTQEPAEGDHSFSRMFRGHANVRTVKSVNFFGPDDEYIMSGSDCGHIFIWDRATGELVNFMRGDEGIVNCIVGHPRDCILASSGLENNVKVWAPLAAEPCDITEANEVMMTNISVQNMYSQRAHFLFQAITARARENGHGDEEGNCTMM